MAEKYTTETGRVYVVDMEAGFWSRLSKTTGEAEAMERLWVLQAGKKTEYPNQNPSNWEDRAPKVGEVLHVASRDVWFVSTPVVKIEKVISVRDHTPMS